jgi:hypothetical protein
MIPRITNAKREVPILTISRPTGGLRYYKEAKLNAIPEEEYCRNIHDIPEEVESTELLIERVMLSVNYPLPHIDTRVCMIASYNFIGRVFWQLIK